MNQERLSKMGAQVRIGGKGTARRKKKLVHRTASTDDKKLNSSLKKLNVNTIPGIEECNMMKDDGTVIHFNNPKVQSSLAANTFAITGHAETKPLTDMLPSILNQLGRESLPHLRRLAQNNSTGGVPGVPYGLNQNRVQENANVGSLAPTAEGDDDDDVPDLVENFDEASKREHKVKVEEGQSASEEKAEVATAVEAVVPPTLVEVGSNIVQEAPLPPVFQPNADQVEPPKKDLVAPIAVEEHFASPKTDEDPTAIVETKEVKIEPDGATLEAAEALISLAQPESIDVGEKKKSDKKEKGKGKGKKGNQEQIIVQEVADEPKPAEAPKAEEKLEPEIKAPEVEKIQVPEPEIKAPEVEQTHVPEPEPVGEKSPQQEQKGKKKNKGKNKPEQAPEIKEETEQTQNKKKNKKKQGAGDQKPVEDVPKSEEPAVDPPKEEKKIEEVPKEEEKKIEEVPKEEEKKVEVPKEEEKKIEVPEAPIAQEVQEEKEVPKAAETATEGQKPNKGNWKEKKKKKKK